MVAECASGVLRQTGRPKSSSHVPTLLENSTTANDAELQQKTLTLQLQIEKRNWFTAEFQRGKAEATFVTEELQGLHSLPVYANEARIKKEQCELSEVKTQIDSLERDMGSSSETTLGLETQVNDLRRQIVRDRTKRGLEIRTLVEDTLVQLSEAAVGWR